MRPPLVYGPGAGGAFARLARAAGAGWPIPLGSVRAPRSIISVRNLCDLLLHIALGPEVGGLRLLAADEQTISIAELARLLSRAAGRSAWILPLPIGVVATALRLANRPEVLAGLTKPFVLRCSLAWTRLGWRPPFLLSDEVQWTMAAVTAGSRPT